MMAPRSGRPWARSNSRAWSRRSHYAPGERGWVKVKNRAYWRRELERESASQIRRERSFRGVQRHSGVGGEAAT
jgi:hypothetical protein